MRYQNPVKTYRAKNLSRTEGEATGLANPVLTIWVITQHDTNDPFPVFDRGLLL
jgi:hypothetical protein